MSAALAHPLPSRHPRVAERPRHIQIVTTRTQRRRRPKLLYALVGVSGLFGILLGQLLLSIALSDGAYQISTLTTERRDLGRTAQALTEQLELMGSSQNLAVGAQGLGMVSSTASAYLRLSDGAVLGSVHAETANGVWGTTLVPNALLAGFESGDRSFTSSAAGPATITPASVHAEPTAPSPAPAPTTPGALPSPVTR